MRLVHLLDFVDGLDEEFDQVVRRVGVVSVTSNAALLHDRHVGISFLKFLLYFEPLAHHLFHAQLASVATGECNASWRGLRDLALRPGS